MALRPGMAVPRGGWAALPAPSTRAQPAEEWQVDRSRRTTVEDLGAKLTTWVPPDPWDIPDIFDGVVPGIRGTYIAKGIWCNEGYFKPWMERPQESNADPALCIMASGKKYRTCSDCEGYFEKTFKDSALCWTCKYVNDVDQFQARHCQCDGCVCVAINEGNKLLLQLARPSSDVVYQLLTSHTKRELIELRQETGGGARLRASSVGRQPVPEPRVPAPPMEFSAWWGGPVARGEEGALREGTARERTASTPPLPTLEQVVELTTTPTSPSGVVIVPMGAQTGPSDLLAPWGANAAFLRGLDMATAVAAAAQAEQAKEAPTTAAPVAGL